MNKMNKLKLLYDVVKVLRDKDVIDGVATVEVHKDQTKIFYVKNQFQKNLVTMQTTANINSELDYDGKKVKHQSTTEFVCDCPGKGMHHKLFKHMHHAGSRCGGIKAKLTKLAFVLDILQRIKAEEQADKTILVTLEVAELPEDIKALIQQKMSHAESDPQREQCCFRKELCCLDKGNVSLAMSVKPNYDIDKIVITFDGEQHDEEQARHSLNLVAELQLNTAL